jgi:hypothetical protein
MFSLNACQHPTFVFVLPAHSLSLIHLCNAGGPGALDGDVTPCLVTKEMSKKNASAANVDTPPRSCSRLCLSTDCLLFYLITRCFPARVLGPNRSSPQTAQCGGEKSERPYREEQVVPSCRRWRWHFWGAKSSSLPERKQRLALTSPRSVLHQQNQSTIPD